MGEIANRRLANLAMLGLWGISMSAALAAPPVGQRAAHRDSRPALESMGTPSRIDSPMQALARRVHREGLPVARLWENKSALVSLGLNQKGKPGLWIIQKIH